MRSTALVAGTHPRTDVVEPTTALIAGLIMGFVIAMTAMAALMGLPGLVTIGRSMIPTVYWPALPIFDHRVGAIVLILLSADSLLLATVAFLGSGGLARYAWRANRRRSASVAHGRFDDHRGAERQQFGATAEDHRRGESGPDNGVGPELVGLLDHTVEGLLPSLGQKLGVLRDLTADDGSPPGFHVSTDVAGPNGVAANQAKGLSYALTCDVFGCGDDHFCTFR